MFNTIAYKYDFLNHFLSLNIDKVWRKKLIKILSSDLASMENPTILDIATGTADLAIAASTIPNVKITGLDIAEGMLAIGQQKINKLNLTTIIELKIGDAENIPFANNTFGSVMVAFGVRNFSNLQKGLSDCFRVLKPGGHMYIIEFSTPQAFPIKQLYAVYFKYVLPALGHVFSKHASAYTYLNKSVLEFPKNEAFLNELSAVGFNNLRKKSLTLGIANIYMAQKKR